MTDPFINQMMTTVTLVSYAGTCLRLLAYQRGLSNYKWTVSLLAWCLIVFTGSVALEMIFHPTQTYLGTAGIALTVFILVWRAKGNVANILRSYP